MNLNFFSEHVVNWNDIEIHPVFDNGEYCEIVEEKQETYWSVYIHNIKGGISCIADVPNKEMAQKLKQLIEFLILTHD
jgi:hypothetical protein